MKLWLVFILFIILINPAYAAISLTDISPSGENNLINPSISFTILEDCASIDCGIDQSSISVEVFQSSTYYLMNRSEVITQSCSFVPITNGFIVSNCHLSEALDYCHGTAYSQTPVSVVVKARNNSEGSNIQTNSWTFGTESGILNFEIFQEEKMYDDNSASISFNTPFYDSVNLLYKKINDLKYSSISTDKSRNYKKSIIEISGLDPQTDYEYLLYVYDRCNNEYSTEGSFLTLKKPEITELIADDDIQEFSDGKNYTLKGINFGEKNPAIPFLWDNFEKGTNGNFVESPNIGTYTQINNAKYNSSFAISGNKSMVSLIRGNSLGEPGAVSNWIPEESKSIFMSMNFRIRSDDIYAHNWKLIRANYHEPDPTHGPPNFNIGKDRGFNYLYSIVNHGEDGQDYVMDRFYLENERWTSISISDEVSSFEHENGEVTQRINSYFGHEKNIATLLPSLYPRSGIRSAYFSAYLSHDGADAELWLDDLYADNTLARIELHNSSDYFNSAMNIQIPHTLWNDNEIHFTANIGSFSDNQNLYLFVIDANGSVSEAFPVNFSRIEYSIYDLNHNTVVDIDDLIILSSDLRNLAYDFNNDYAVNILDMLVLINNIES